MKPMSKDLFKSLKRNRLSEDIVNYIKNLIVEGKLKPLDRLPSERELAERFGVGRPTVREAIRSLELMGLVEVHSGQKGTVIKNPELATYMESVVEQMSWLVQIELTTLKQLLEVRDSLERGIAIEASKRATKEQLNRMKKILTEMKRCTGDVDAYIKKGIEFHSTLAEATHNPIYHIIWTRFSDLIFNYYHKLLKGYSQKTFKKLCLANDEIYEAILTEDPEKINAAMDNHIETERDILWAEQDKGSNYSTPSSNGFSSNGHLGRLSRL